MTVTQKCDDWSHCLFKNQTWEQCCQLFLLPADDVCLLSTTLVIHRDTFIHRYTYRLQNKNFHPKNPNTLWRKRARFVQGFKKNTCIFKWREAYASAYLTFCSESLNKRMHIFSRADSSYSDSALLYPWVLPHPFY